MAEVVKNKAGGAAEEEPAAGGAPAAAPDASKARVVYYTMSFYSIYAILYYSMLSIILCYMPTLRASVFSALPLCVQSLALQEST